MKKLPIILSILIMVGCTSEPKVKYSPSFKDDTVKAKYEKNFHQKYYDDNGNELSYMEYMEYLNTKLKDWPFPGANGEWIPSRDGIENSDTVVNGFPYNRVI